LHDKISLFLQFELFHAYPLSQFRDLTKRLMCIDEQEREELETISTKLTHEITHRAQSYQS
jgi:hypothetical protein